VDSTTILQPDTWYFLAMTSDPTGATLYIYNEAGTQLEVTASPGPFPWVTGSDGIAIGNNPNNNSGLYGLIGAGPEPFGGVVDEVRVYGAAVSQTQLELDLQTPLP
jgi:hypothetical protein